VLPWTPVDAFKCFALVIGMLICAPALKGVFIYLQDVLVGDVAERALMNVRKKLLRRILTLDYQTLSAEGTGGLMSRFTYDTEQLATVAERALQQSELTTPAALCVSFAQPDVADLRAIGWNCKQHVQDANFGTLNRLQAMVAQTLAAWYAEAHQVPCAWLANDPHHTLALGVMEPDDSTN
ncbi:MAG: ABC transporter transmembrane domain-containing protein, partial [Pseudomonas sp.]|uniref:ABC transporter transmembrane domain-containing protein n=1 Tax=Pseudomonas sp. TaxID=306 RepID=UPI00391A460A